MKMTKKILALVMAVAMLFSLCMFSANAYDNNGYVNVEIQLYGSYAWDISLTQTMIAAYKGRDVAPVSPYTANPDHIYYVPDAANPSDDPYTTALTATDAILAAYLETYGPYSASQVHYTWYENSGNWGVYFDCYEGLTPDLVGQYYIVDSWYANGKWYYEYYWEGEAWILYINGVKTSLFSSEYELGTSYTEFSNAQPTSIVLDYNFERSGNFVTNTYIPSAIPAPAAP